MNIDLYDKLFSKAIKQRGEELFNSGFVKFIKKDKNDFHFKVNGNIENYYDVIINVEDNKVKQVSCDCLFDGFCKHQYACLLELSNMESVEFKNSNYIDKIKTQSKEDLVNDLVYLYNKYDFVNKYYQLKYNPKFSLTDLLNKFSEIVEDYDNAMDELEYLYYDDVIDDERFEMIREYGDYHFDINESYFFNNLTGVVENIVILFNVNYNESNLIKLLKYLIGQSDDIISIIQLSLSELFILIDKKIDSMLLEKVLMQFKNISSYKLFLRFYKYINKENCGLFYSVFKNSCCNSEKFLNKYESFLLEYYENEIYEFYGTYVTTNDYHKKYTKYLLENDKIKEVENLANKLYYINDKEYIYEKLFYYFINKNLDGDKYGFLCLNDTNIQDIYDLISNKKKLLDVIEARLNNELPDSLSEKHVFAFYCNNNFIEKALEFIKEKNYLLKNNFHKIYSFDNNLALDIFKCYLDNYIKDSNSNSHYKTIRVWFERCYFRKIHSFFVEYAHEIINNTRKRNLKAELNSFLSKINYENELPGNYSLF